MLQNTEWAAPEINSCFASRLRGSAVHAASNGFVRAAARGLRKHEKATCGNQGCDPNPVEIHPPRAQKGEPDPFVNAGGNERDRPQHGGGVNAHRRKRDQR